METEREMERLRHDLELKRLEAEMMQNAPPGRAVAKAKVPNLLAFVDGKDNLDSYLQRFERFATSNDWQKDTWRHL